jgi:hypothetical protein
VVRLGDRGKKHRKRMANGRMGRKQQEQGPWNGLIFRASPKGTSGKVFTRTMDRGRIKGGQLLLYMMMLFCYIMLNKMGR